MIVEAFPCAVGPTARGPERQACKEASIGRCEWRARRDSDARPPLGCLGSDFGGDRRVQVAVQVVLEREAQFRERRLKVLAEGGHLE